MKRIVSIFSENKYFIWLVFIYSLLTFCLLIFCSKKALFLEINGFHHPFLDTFFFYATSLGSGWIYLPFFIILLLIRFRFALITFFASILQTILVQVAKHHIFSEAYRPLKYFGNDVQLHLVEGVKVLSYHSFPSGHAASAFTVFTLLALFVKPKWTGLLFFILAFIAGFSRIYLAQHFPEDVFAGSFIGFISAFIFYFFLGPDGKWNPRSGWTEKSLLNRK